MSAQRLLALRGLMGSQSKPLAAYIIPTADAHNSEYICPTDARREWITQFTGSAGTAVVTPTRALVWTDGRYYTQFQQEVDMSLWTLMKQSLPETPTMEKWLISNLDAGAIVAADPTTMKRGEWAPLKTALNQSGMELLPITTNLVDAARVQMNDPPPPRPANQLMVLPVKFTGKTAGKKVNELRETMVEKRASALILTALDETAYVLNLRGSDIEYNPVFFSYLIIKPDSVHLFWKDGVLSQEVLQHFKEECLENVKCHRYDEALEYIAKMAKELSENGDAKPIVWLSHDASEAVHNASSAENEKNSVFVMSEVSPVAVMKLFKNEVELAGFRNCHIKDGIAVIRFFRWLHEAIDKGEQISEGQASHKLLEFRQDEEDFLGPSFETIPGSGANGAIIHYKVDSKKPPKIIERDNMFLLDSGGQYRDGTTDITRTRHMSGNPTAAQKAAFTRVLKGQIGMASALFPKGVKGNVLDSFARRALWDAGLDYAHGTGHGVGHCLNVHEGPAGVSWRPYPDDPGLRAGAVLSDEPGYYEVGAYGIRHEDLVETIDITPSSPHPKAKGLVGDYDGRGVLGFNTITLVPNQKESIDVSLLTDFELEWTNSYHKRVFCTIGPILKKRGLEADHDWLEKECMPITRQ